MEPDTFIDSFALMADAPNGVQKLRDMILQLAMQGKLVPQDPNDEPASVLLEKLKIMQDQLIKEKKIKKQIPATAIKDEEKDFEVPETWEWSKIGWLCDLKTGATPSRSKKEYFGGSIKWLVSGDIHKREIFDCAGRITELGIQNSNCKILPINSVLIALNGQGKTRATVALLRSPAACNQSLVAMTPRRNDICFAEYIFWYLRGCYYSLRDITGQKQRRGLNMKIIGNLIIPLPPLAEQKRIVEKVDQLMKICDELEERKQKVVKNRIQLNDSAIDKLLTANEPDEFNIHWNRISNNFDLLYNNPENVAKLRQAILQLAVQGKLVPQDPDDEPASELLKKIAEEKAELIRNKKIKKQKPLPEVRKDEKTFDIAEGWEWCRLGELSEISSGSTPLKSKPEYYINGKIPWITSTLTSKNFIDNSETFITKLAVKECRLKIYPSGTLLMAMYGQGKTRGQVSELLIEAATNQACAAIVLNNLAKHNKPYLKLVLKNKYDEIRELAEGGAQPNLNGIKVRNMPIPLPPLNEQKRIVEKVDHLMKLCDKLESRLVKSQIDCDLLVDASIMDITAA